MTQGVLCIVLVVFVLIARAKYQSRLYCKDYLLTEGWRSRNSYGEKISLYHFVSSPLSNNTESESHCMQYGAKLSTAKSGEEIEFLKSLSPDISNRTVYVGLIRNALVNMAWTWNDDDFAAEIIFNTGFPQKGHNCGCIYCYKDSCGLVSSQCDVKREFFCKYTVVSEILIASILADFRDIEIKTKWNQIPFNGTSQTLLKNLILGLLPNLDWTITNSSYSIEGNIIRIDLVIDKSAMDSANISAIENSLRNIQKTPTQPWNYWSFGNGASIEPSSEVVVNGTLFHLNCTCQSESVAVLEWIYEGINLNEQNAKKNIQFKVTHNDTKGFISSTLTFQPVLKEDSGYYECIVTTYMGCILAKSGIRVHVRVPTVVDVFPLITSVEQGSNASIFCSLRDASEQVYFIWFRNGTQLGNESGFT
ncbi:hypothetical protein CHS0354_026648, partial [Potamilus streckersoni]